MDQESKICTALICLESIQYKSVHAAVKATNVLCSTLSYWQKGGKAKHKAYQDQ